MLRWFDALGVQLVGDDILGGGRTPVDLLSVVVTLFLIMDPLGNIPVFLSVLKQVAPERRRLVLVREILFAYAVLLIFLFFGNYLLRLLHLQQEAVSISGGIVTVPDRAAYDLSAGGRHAR